MKERWEKTLLCRIGNIENARALYGALCRLSVYLCNLATQNFISLFIYLPCCHRLQCRNWKLKPWRAREQYSKGKIGLFCCVIAMVHLGEEGGGKGGEVTSFWWAQRNILRKSRESTYGHLHLDHAVFLFAVSFFFCVTENYMWTSCLTKKEQLFCPTLNSAPRIEECIGLHCPALVSAPWTESFLL